MMIRRRGVTLVEVLATLVLVGIVLPAAMRCVTMSLRAASKARHNAEAAVLAQNKIAEFLVLRDAELLDGAGDFGAAWPEYRWESRSAQRDFGCYEVTVSVTWSERGRARSVELSTLVYPQANATIETTAGAS